MRVEQITFTRFIAAILVVVFHFGRGIFPFDHNTVKNIFDNANSFVSYFFVLSGFVMIIAYSNKNHINYVDYLKNRFARVYPAYLLAIILLLLVSLININESINIQNLILNLFTIQAWFPGHALSVNIAAWSLSVEFFFYSLFPLLYNNFYSKYRLKNIFITISIIWILSQILFLILVKSNLYTGYPSSSHDLLYYFPPMHLSEFLVGNLAGIIFLNKNIWSNKKFDLIIIFIATLIVFSLSFPFAKYFHNGLIAPVFALLICLLSQNGKTITNILKLKPLVFLGEISYGIYIFQMPVFFYFRAENSMLFIDNPSARFYISLATLIILSALSFIFIETPFRKMLKKISLKRVDLKTKESM